MNFVYSNRINKNFKALQILLFSLTKMWKGIDSNSKWIRKNIFVTYFILILFQQSWKKIRDIKEKSSLLNEEKEPSFMFLSYFNR